MCFSHGSGVDRGFGRRIGPDDGLCGEAVSDANGAFKSRKQLLDVSGLGEVGLTIAP